MIFPYLPGSSSPAFRGISIFLGVLFSLGSASSISNMISGIILTYMRAFEVGDRVKIADTTGDVTEKTLLITRVRTIKNVDITIPNAMVLGSHIINFSSSKARGCAPQRRHYRIRRPLEEGARTSDRGRQATENFAGACALCFQTALDDFYVQYEINAYTGSPTRWRKSTLICTKIFRTDSTRRGWRSFRRTIRRSATATRPRFRRLPAEMATRRLHFVWE